jgi:hypothetical protein
MSRFPDPSARRIRTAFSTTAVVSGLLICVRDLSDFERTGNPSSRLVAAVDRPHNHVADKMINVGSVDPLLRPVTLGHHLRASNEDARIDL